MENSNIKPPFAYLYMVRQVFIFGKFEFSVSMYIMFLYVIKYTQW